MSARLRAFFIHMAASALMALLAIGVVFLAWYPHPLAVATGVTSIFLIVLGVDAVIGPLLTLLVYRTGKKTLRFDLMVIVGLQLLAFGYGMWTVHQGRPAWLVFNADRFDLVRVNEIDDRALTQADAAYRTPPWTGPRWVHAQRPESAEERQTLLFESVATGVDLAQRPQYYRPLNEAAAEMRQHALPLPDLEQFNPPEKVAQVLRPYPVADSWLPMKSVARSMVVLLHRDTAQVVAIVNLRPWND